MNLGIFAKRAAKLVADNSPAMLTALGVTGTLTSVYLTAKASFKAARVLDSAEKDQNIRAVNDPDVFPLTVQEKALLTWKFYVPAAGIAALTVASIIGANHISTRRAAALASAYSVSEKMFAEYKAKVVDKMGEKKEQAVRDEIAKDKVRETPQKSEIIMVGSDVLCFDMRTGRYFKSDMESLRKAENDTNKQIISDCYASLTDYYDRIGLPRTDESDELGWDTDTMLDVAYSSVLSEDGRPCLAICFNTKPSRDYHRFF